jgi:hypothetical protein
MHPNQDSSQFNPSSASPPEQNSHNQIQEPPINQNFAANPQTQLNSMPVESEHKDFVVAFLLSWLLGSFGADRFYLGYTGLGIFKLLTLGGLGLWALIDVALLAFGKMKDKSKLPMKGYESNKSWVRILAIIHLLIFGLIIVGFMLSFLANIALQK